MGWTKVDMKEPHVCDKPYYAGEGVSTGDVVRCDCGLHWKCTGVDHGMQWDPFPRGVLQWKKINHD